MYLPVLQINLFVSCVNRLPISIYLFVYLFIYFSVRVQSMVDDHLKPFWFFRDAGLSKNEQNWLFEVWQIIEVSKF